MKKIFYCLFVSILLLNHSTVNADYMNEVIVSEEQMPNGDIIKTVIGESYTQDSSITFFRQNLTKQKYKTAYYIGADGNKKWSISIIAEFSYNGVTANVIQYSHSAVIYDKLWHFNNVSSSASGNSATATATAQMASGSSYNRVITIYCSPNGTIS